MNQSTRAKILIIKLGALGDLILADGAFRDIRTHHRDAEIHLLTRKPFASLMSRCPWIDVLHVDANAPRWRLDSMLKWRGAYLQQQFDNVYDLQNSNRTAFYRRRLAPSDDAWSYLEKGDSRCIGLSVPERHRLQLEIAGLTTRHAGTPCPEWIPEDASELIRGSGITSPYVLLLPGASGRHPEKRWPHFMELSRELVRLGMTVVVILGPDERNDDRTYAGTVLSNGSHWLSLPELAYVAKHAACVIGNDSGPTHLAACINASCVVLFSDDNPSCSSTGIERRNATKLTAKSLEEITVDLVIAAVVTQNLKLSY